MDPNMPQPFTLGLRYPNGKDEAGERVEKRSAGYTPSPRATRFVPVERERLKALLLEDCLFKLDFELIQFSPSEPLARKSSVQAINLYRPCACLLA